jgi:hypothetical protein
MPKSDSHSKFSKKLLLTILFAGLVFGGLALLAASAARADTYFNSSEPGCNPSSPNPNYLMCDDFEISGVGNSPNGHWYGEDCDTANANGGIATRTKGWCGTIYANPITPAGAAYCGSKGIGGTDCAATSGVHPGSSLTATVNAGDTTIPLIDTSSMPSSSSGSYKLFNDTIQWTGKTATTITGVSGITKTYGAGSPLGVIGGRNMAQHGFIGGAVVNEAYWRLYFQPQANYNGGHEKMFDFLGQGSGPILEVCYNYFGSETIKCIPFIHQPGWLGSNISTAPTLVPGHWYFIEMHVKLNTPGVSDGVFEMWMDDCGTNGLGCKGTPTLRMRYNNVLYRNNTTEANIQISGIWIENWANAPTVGEMYYDQLIVSKTGPIGFMGSTPPTPPNGSPSTLIVSP